MVKPALVYLDAQQCLSNISLPIAGYIMCKEEHSYGVYPKWFWIDEKVHYYIW